METFSSTSTLTGMATTPNRPLTGGPDGRRDPVPLVGEMYAELVAATESVSHGAERALEPAGLSLPQFHVLQILGNAGTAGLLVHEVGQRMVARAPNITRLVDKLEEKNLVARVRSESDRRTVRLELTANGRERLEALEGLVAERLAEAMQLLSDEDLVRLRTLLGLLRRQSDAPVGELRQVGSEPG